MPLLSSIDPHYLAGVLDHSLTIKIKEEKNGRIKVRGEVRGHRRLMSFVQSLVGGSMSAKRENHGLLISFEALCPLATYLIDTPSSMQGVYACLLQLKKIRSDIKQEALNVYRISLADVISRLKESYQSRFDAVTPSIKDIRYQAGYVEASRWLRPRLARESYEGSIRLRWPNVKTKTMYGQTLIDWISIHSPHMRFRRELFDLAARYELERRAGHESSDFVNQFETYESQFEMDAVLTYGLTAEEYLDKVGVERQCKTDAKAIKERRKIEDKERKTIQHEVDKATRKAERRARTLAKEAKVEETRDTKRQQKAARRAQEIESVKTGMMTCRKCTETKPIDQFSKNARSHTGYSLHCWECGKEAYYLPNRDRQIARAKKWIKTHPDEVREHRRKDRRKPHNRVKANVSKRIKEYLKATSTAGQWREIISCSPQDLVKHLESQFIGDMSWANYGTLWHIDHIIPCAAFDWSRPSHLIWCWHHLNLRPLLASENVIKADILSNGQTASYLRDCDLETLKKVVGGDLEKLGIASVDEWAASWDAPVEIRYISV